MKPFVRIGSIAALSAAMAMPRAALASDWPVFGHDPARSGVDVGDGILTRANVHRLRAVWQIAFPNHDVADSTPILLQDVRVRGVRRTMLYQTTKQGITYGIEAGSGSIVWHFTTHGPKITTSTPAADPSGKAIYVPGIDGFVRKLDASTGHELSAPGFPARITKMVETEKNASPLNVANGYLYAVTSGYIGDAPPYDGHVVGVRLADGHHRVWNSLCSNDRKLPTPTSCQYSDSGIWSRGGAVVDPDSVMNGEVYLATGNGQFDCRLRRGRLRRLRDRPHRRTARRRQFVHAGGLRAARPERRRPRQHVARALTSPGRQRDPADAGARRQRPNSAPAFFSASHRRSTPIA